MNPCYRNRKSIALLLLNQLDAEAEQEIQAHLATCRGCESYFRELSIVSQRLRSTRVHDCAPATDAFHRRVVGALKAETLERNGARVPVWLNSRPWPWFLGVPAAVAIVLFAGILLFQRPAPVPPTGPVRERPSRESGPRAEVEPTVSNYQMVADRSFESLDELLTAQATRQLPSIPVYRASALSDQLQ